MYLYNVYIYIYIICIYIYYDNMYVHRGPRKTDVCFQV